MFDNLREHIEKTLEHWKVPGVAVSIVKDGEVVLAEGYGYKDLENKKPMTADTIMPIGSATKSFTAMTAGMLVDEGKAAWDAPVSEYIPGFRMYDRAANAITLRDMLSHRGGMPRHDLMWAVSDNFTRKDLIRRVRHLKNNVPFRSLAQYQNHMFGAVGYAVEQILGKTWEQFVEERIFGPLGMKANFSNEVSKKMPDYALPYKHNKEKDILPAQFMEVIPCGPAGNINSSVNEMAKWLMLALNEGEFNGSALVKKETWAEMTSPVVHIRELPWEFDEIKFLSYGLGWFMEIYNGQKVIHHGGNVTGFTSNVAIMPSQNLGVCILANMNSTFLPTALMNEIFDRVLGYESGDWNNRYSAETDKLFAAHYEGEAAREKQRKTGTKPTLEYGAYIGTYEHPGYGICHVSAAEEGKDGYSVDLNGAAQTLTHWHYDHFVLSLKPFDFTLLARFNIGSNGKIESLQVPFEGDIVFKKKEEEVCSAI